MGHIFFYFDSTEASKIKLKEMVWTTNSQLDLMDLVEDRKGENGRSSHGIMK